MKGLAYIFLRKDGAPVPTGCAGHVGWGFAFPGPNGDLDAIAGSTENFEGSPIIRAGDDNGFWWHSFRTDDQMFKEMAKRNYDGYKVATVRDCQPDKAKQVANQTKAMGYHLIGNNCLDHAYAVLEAYGVKDLPWKQTHPSPNDWFAHFNGAYHNL